MFFIKKQRFCNRMMTFAYVFGGILLQKSEILQHNDDFWKYGVQMFDMLRAGLFGGRHSMCGIQSHITL